MSNKNISGRCLCGDVEVTATPKDQHAGACHCNTCRRWGGGPFMTIESGPETQINGDDFVGRFQSSEWAERGFCKQCGTHLFYRLTGNGAYFLPAGLFLDEPGFEAALDFDHQVFIDQKPDYYNFSNDTKKLTAAQVFEFFGNAD